VVADVSARLRNTGDHAGALDAGQRACSIAARLQDRDLQVLATYRLAQAHFAVGDFARSVDLLRETLGALGEGPAPPDSRLPAYLAAWPRAWLALGLSSLGFFAKKRSSAVSRSTRWASATATRLSRLGEGYLLAGRLREARERADHALALARAQKERDNEAWAVRLLGAIAARGSPLDIATAKEQYGSALALAEQSGTRRLVAHCHRGLGELYRRTDNTAKATAHTAMAQTMYGELGMRWWLEQAEGGGTVAR
jgi:tetratricopeptide (TPR) repeat protein